MAATKIPFDIEIGGNILPINDDSVILVGVNAGFSQLPQERIKEIEELLKTYFPNNKVLIYNKDCFDIKVSFPINKESAE